MKKNALITLFYVFNLILCISCSEEHTSEGVLEENQIEKEFKSLCSSYSRSEKLSQANFKRRQSIEKHIKSFIVDKILKKANGQKSNERLIEIPIVIHSFWTNLSHKLTREQAREQIDILNEDFAMNNPDLVGLPDEFENVKSTHINIQFRLKKIIYKRVTNEQWRRFKRNRSFVKNIDEGGSAAINYKKNLNIWLGNFDGGFSSWPWDNAENRNGVVLDGIVVNPGAFGADNVYNGHLLTHEVGHYLGLNHTWSDVGNDPGRWDSCNFDDGIADTPNTIGSQAFQCPDSLIESCDSTDMTMNFMDYTTCAYMFTEGQKTVIRSMFAQGGPRERLGNDFR